MKTHDAIVAYLTVRPNKDAKYNREYWLSKLKQNSVIGYMFDVEPIDPE